MQKIVNYYYHTMITNDNMTKISADKVSWNNYHGNKRSPGSPAVDYGFLGHLSH